MGVVGEQQAQRVLAERQRDLRFGLPGAEMQVVVALRMTANVIAPVV